MPTLREAAQQALEALCHARSRLDHSPAEWDCDTAIETLRSALAEPVQAPDPGEYHGWVLREVLFDNGEPVGHREPVQEPVAWLYEDTLPKEYPYDAMWPHSAIRDGVRMFPVYTAPPQRKPLTDEEAEKIIRIYDGGNSEVRNAMRGLKRALEAAHGIKGEA